MIRDLAVAFLLLTGSVFVLLAAVGIVRMPDFFSRLQATTKATTLGVGLVLGAVPLADPRLATTARVVAIILFVALTTPVGAHMLGRAARRSGVPIWPGTILEDEDAVHAPSDPSG